MSKSAKGQQQRDESRNVFPAVASTTDDDAFDDSPYASDAINAPLLSLSPHADDAKHGAHPHDGLSAFGAAGFMVSIILGLGVLGIPWALAQVRGACSAKTNSPTFFPVFVLPS